MSVAMLKTTTSENDPVRCGVQWHPRPDWLALWKRGGGHQIRNEGELERGGKDRKRGNVMRRYATRRG